MRNLIAPPVSRVQEPVLFAKNLKLIHRPVGAIPSRVHPEIFKADFFFRDLVDKLQTGRGLHATPSQMRHGQSDGFSVVLWRVILQDMAPQNIVSVGVVAFPRKQQDFWGANLLAGMQREMGCFHAGTNRNHGLGGAREIDRPLARPAQGADEAVSSRLNIEERYEFSCLAAAFVRNLK